MAAPFLDFLLGLEGLAAVAVVALVDALVDVARVEDGLDELLAAGVMARFARLDEFVVRDVERAPDFLELAGHVVDVLLGLDAQLAARWGTLIVFSSLPIRKWTSSPSMRRNRACTSAPIFSNAVPMCGRLLG